MSVAPFSFNMKGNGGGWKNNVDNCFPNPTKKTPLAQKVCLILLEDNTKTDSPSRKGQNFYSLSEVRELTFLAWETNHQLEGLTWTCSVHYYMFLLLIYETEFDLHWWELLCEGTDRLYICWKRGVYFFFWDVEHYAIIASKCIDKLFIN